MNAMQRPESIHLRQLVAAQMLSVVALALLHARQLHDPAGPYVGAAEIFTDWSPIASELMAWWSPDEQREALAEAEYLLRNFAAEPLMPSIPGGRTVGFVPKDGKLIPFIFPKES